MIAVMWLPFSYTSEKPAVEGFCERGAADVVHGNVGMNAGLNIAVRIHVEITAPAGDASLHVRAVIPEIEKEHRLGRAEAHDLATQVVPLLRGDHERKICPPVHR